MTRGLPLALAALVCWAWIYCGPPAQSSSGGNGHEPRLEQFAETLSAFRHQRESLTAADRVRRSADLYSLATTPKQLRQAMAEHAEALIECGLAELADAVLDMLIAVPPIGDPLQPSVSFWRPVRLRAASHEAGGNFLRAALVLDRALGVYGDGPPFVMEDAIFANFRAGRAARAEELLVQFDRRFSRLIDGAYNYVVGFDERLALHRALGDPNSLEGVLEGWRDWMYAETLLHEVPSLHEGYFFAVAVVSGMGSARYLPVVEQAVASLAEKQDGVRGIEWRFVSHALAIFHAARRDGGQLLTVVQEVLDRQDAAELATLAVAMNELSPKVIRQALSAVSANPDVDPMSAAIVHI